MWVGRRGNVERCDRCRAGFVLLEVVLSIGLLVLGLSVLGGQINRSWESAHASADLTRVLMLTESKIAELETGLVYFTDDADDEIEGDFTLRFPHYGWRMRVAETATEGLWAVTLEILYARRESLEDDFDLEGAEVVHRVHLLRAEPAMLDVETDLGLDEEAVFELTEKLPAELFDPPSFDPTIVKQLDMEQLVEVLPSLLSLFGDNASLLLASLPPEFRAMLDLEGLNLGTDDAGADGGEASGSDGVDLTDEELEAFGVSREEFETSQRGANSGRGGGVGATRRPQPSRGGSGSRRGGGGG